MYSNISFKTLANTCRLDVITFVCHVPKPINVVLLHKLARNPLFILLVQCSLLVIRKLSLNRGANLIMRLSVSIFIDDLLSSLDMSLVLFNKVLLILQQLKLHLFVGLISDLILNAFFVSAT